MANHEIRAATLLDLDVLDCPVCSEPLTIPTFQCDDGHLVCSICSTKLINKCPVPGCDLPIGNKRCFPMEKVLEAVFVLCRNAEFGCRQSFSYAKVSSHEKECNFFQCPCPDLECNYTGSYNNMYRHFVSNHVYNRNKSPTILMRNTALRVGMNINEKFLVLWDPRERLFIVVQCFRERQGFYVSLRSIIAPPAAELVKIAYSLS